MKKRVLNLVSFLIIILLVLLAGCYTPGGPVPEEPYPSVERAWTQEEVDAAVAVEEVSIYAPAPRDNGVPPEAADYITFLRFRSRSAGDDPADADAVLVVMPGFYCGSNAFYYLGRQMVYMASLRGADIEVWAVERRPNRLEDLAGLNAAEGAGDATAAVDYYNHGVPVEGKTFGGFLTDATAPYLSEFGMELVMEDVYAVITTMVPDPEVRRGKVFVGGHSLGGPLTHIFAAWDFDGDPATLDDAGYRNCAGLVGLDGALSLTMGMMEPATDALPANPPDVTDDDGMEAYYAQLVQGMREGTMPRIFPLLTPDAPMVMELAAMEADQQPQEESTLLEEVPETELVDLMLKLLHSRSLDHFLVHVPDITDFRYTCEALLGAILDDNFMPVKIVQASMGFLQGGSVVRKDFPLPADLAQVPLLGDLLGSFISLDGLFIANDAGPSVFALGKGPLYSWVDFDQVGRPADPAYQDRQGNITYTTMMEEVSDIRDVAQVVYKGTSNLLEWYFTMRLMVDMMALLFPFAPDYGLNYLHAADLGDMPKLEIMAGSNLNPFSQGTPPGERLVLEGYNHIDVLTAAADRPSLRENEAFDPLIDFMLKNSTAP
ncbi:MAG: hypothetical protein C4536_14600 [Actinobacteria bacterium]|jgi:hypothetical protein|nr:MAG: hypothetical protein C4536_14600 [Actinomycetota bacterium]